MEKTSAGEKLPAWCVETFLRSDPTIRYKIAYGGRGSGKSWAFAIMAIMRAAYKPIRVLCARELQNSVRDSVHTLIKDQIVSLGMSGHFIIREREILGRNGSSFMFKGLRGMRNDASEIKSLEGVDICWVEEAQMISAASLETLLPTIRKPRSEIWFTMNPSLASDPVYQMINEPPNNAVVRKVNWNDNPWFSDTSLVAEKDYKQRVDPDGYRHVWEGECRSYSDAQILKHKYVVDVFEPQPHWSIYQGADWGFSQDPTTLMRVYVDESVLYVHRECYEVGCEIDATPALFDNVSDSYYDARRVITRADPARPETISYLNRHGYPNIKSHSHWKGSVEDGIQFLRSFERIIIHPQCKHAIEEASLWSFQVDKKSGDVLPKVQDGNDHCWDAIRYALSPLIKKRTIPMVTGNIAGL